MRGQARDYDQWAKLTGDDSWSWQNVLPVFQETEDHHAGKSEFHGAGGEWRVEQQRLRWDVLDAFRVAAAETGIPMTEDFNQGDNEGCGYFEVNQKKGIRWNTSKAFLRSVKKRHGSLEIMTGCHVKRLDIIDTDQGKRCRGVQFTGDGREWFAESRRETLLSAGAIGSPQILQLSGIGPADLLQKHGVPVVVDAPGVGENLQDHLQLRMAFKVQGVKTLNMMANSLLGKLRIGLEYAVNRSGPMSMAPSQLGAFTKSDPSQASANLQYHVQPLSLEKFGEPLHCFPAFTASVCNLRPTSRGHVRIISGDPYAAPSITPNYLTTPEDRRVAADSLKLTRRIVAAPAMRQFSPEEFMPGVNFQTEEELAHAAGNIGTTIFHPVGTCKMGRPEDVLAVVDQQMRVKQVKGLRVVDGSVMPLITSGNPNSPIIMIAERAAQSIRADWSSQGK